MNDIAMTKQGDLALKDYDIVTTDSIEQAILIRLRWFFSEWVYDTDLGVEWFEKVLIKSPNKLLVRRMIEDTILSVDGVTDVSDVKLTIFNSTRKAQISFKYKITMGAYDMMETVKFDSDVEEPYAAGSTIILPPNGALYYLEDDALVFTSLSTAGIAGTKLVIGGANE
jgi:hypothetical protein